MHGCARRRELSAADRSAAEGILAATREVDRSLAVFEASAKSHDGVAPREAARRVLEDALAARNVLELTPPTPFLVYARDEQLTYLNHLVPGFRTYLERGRSDRAGVDQLLSIIRRGRVHQQRGLDRMKAAGLVP